MLYKAYKYRLYPNKEQESLIERTFGCCRFVYNQTLAYKKETWETEKKSLSYYDLAKYLSHTLKEEYPWLKEVDTTALIAAIQDMCSAYNNFFKNHKGYPKFKSKHNNYQSYRAKQNIVVDFEHNTIKLPKLGSLKAKLHRKFTGRIINATVSKVPSGKYYVSVLVETKHEELPHTNTNIGLDLGLKDLITTSNGEKYTNPKTLQKYEKQITKLQRNLSHKKKGSKNRAKLRKKLAICHEHLTNTRKDYLNKLSHRLISENQVIVIESLNVKNMLQNHNLAKSISDASWYEFTRQLDYKATWNKRHLIKIDKFFPSSQLCSNCGYKNPSVKDLSVRQWTCPHCGVIHDRDINAAKNILAEGLKQIA